MAGALDSLGVVVHYYLIYCGVVMSSLTVAVILPLCAYEGVLRRHPRYMVKVVGWDSYGVRLEAARYFLTRSGGWRWTNHQSAEFAEQHRGRGNLIELDEPLQSRTLYLSAPDVGEDPYEAEVSMTLTPLAA